MAMRSPVLGGTITSSKREHTTESSLRASGDCGDLAKVVKGDNSQISVMENTHGSHHQAGKCGGGNDASRSRRESGMLQTSIGGEVPTIRVNNADVAVANHARNIHVVGAVGNDSHRGGQANGSRHIARNKAPNRSIPGINLEASDDEEEMVRVGDRYEDYFKIREKDEVEYGVKPKGLRNSMKRIARTMGCGTSQVFTQEEAMPVVVFGATGTLGGAVVRALLKDPRFNVRAVTRTPTTDQARALAEEGAVVVNADLNDTRSLVRVMEGAAGVFLTTNYWEHLSKQKEITHGMNAVDAAVSCNIHHFIYHGSVPTDRDGKPCGYMDGKAAVEEYVKETTLPYTAVRSPFFYENLIGLFKPHPVKPGTFTIPIPMEEKSLDCMALHDFARCVVNIFLRPRNHMMKSVHLTTERMTIQHMADVINKHADDKKLVYHRMSPADYANFDFQGCQDMAAMFAAQQTSPPRDPRITKRIYGGVVGFDKWVHDNRAKIIDVMKTDDENSSA